MKKLVALLFGLLVVATGFAAATIWEVTAVHQRNEGHYGWAYAEVGVKYDVQHPYTNYQITYRYGTGGLLVPGYTANVNKYWDPNGITVETVVKNSEGFVMEKVYASAGWPYI
ncbi:MULTISPECIES: hypothetical protein [Thermococcus]|uniref:Uncharacterized protein n=1 Tax=Thermococcus nautili TaxID=195522 RepID=W8NTU6_9EURY|nr:MULTISPECIES: hypothetical protein [Thermococcus]AHL22562.1 hypothetical protein BD01_0943 [Thermococcus nautili]NJE48174.1 hypothetical protein [Thermococcus sp. 9N3]CAI1493391.1 conserved exported protein of unknown function [Thermococcus nautili]